MNSGRFSTFFQKWYSSAGVALMVIVCVTAIAGTSADCVAVNRWPE